MVPIQKFKITISDSLVMLDISAMSIGFERTYLYYSTDLVFFTRRHRKQASTMFSLARKTLIFTVDGRNLHLKSFTGPNESFWLNLDERKEYYMLQQLCEMLNFGSNYHSLVDGGRPNTHRD
jgi:hypothetical protein